MVSINDPTAQAYQLIDSAVARDMCFYLTGSIGMFKTYNFTMDAYDMSAYFKIKLSGETIKINTDTMTMTASFFALTSEEEIVNVVVQTFAKMIPHAAVLGAYEYWHCTYTGPKKLWEFMQMDESAFDNMMLKGKLPAKWNPVFGGMNIMTSTDITKGTFRIENADGTFTDIKLGD